MDIENAKLTPGPNNMFTMVGDLMMHGVTKPGTLAGTVMGSTRTRNGRVVGYSASGKIDRRDWNISSVPAAVGDDVTLDLEIAATAKEHRQDDEFTLPRPRAG